VQSKADRDGAIDEMLKKVLRTEAAHATVSDECLDGESIAAWKDGALPSAGAHIETHLSQCARCQAVLAALVRSTPPPAAVPSLWQRWHLRWAVPIAAAASAVALWFAVPSDQRAVVSQQRATLEDSRPSVASSPAPPPAAAAEPREQMTGNQERRADVRGRQQALAKNSDQPSASADKAAPPALERDTAAAESLREGTAAPQTAPAAPPPERRELSAQRQAQAIVEALAPDPANRWRIVNRARIERSTDSGASWQAVAFPETTDLAAIRALSALSAIVTTSDGRQLRTDDAGITWTPIRD
jgi:hypothetical protein